MMFKKMCHHFDGCFDQEEAQQLCATEKHRSFLFSRSFGPALFDQYLFDHCGIKWVPDKSGVDSLVFVWSAFNQCGAEATSCCSTHDCIGSIDPECQRKHLFIHRGPYVV